VNSVPLSPENLSQSILDSIQTRIAVVDENGAILVVNDAWIRFAQENGDPLLHTTSVGINYFEVTRRSADAGDSSSPKVLKGIERVLSGKLAMFELRYPCHSPTEERWYLMRITPLKGENPRGLVISHIDITSQHLTARARLRKARSEDLQRQYRRDIESYEETRVAAHSSLETDEEKQIQQQYSVLLDAILEKRLFKVERETTGQALQIAQQLARQMAGPRELIRIHAQTMEEKQQPHIPVQRQKAYFEEGRLLLIEVMGYLTTFYRDMIVRNFEQQNL
jgi:PAS fold